MKLEVTEGQHQKLSVYKQLMNNGAVENPWGRPFEMLAEHYEAN